MAAVPMFTSVSAAVSADPLANLLSACVLLVLIRQVCRPAAVKEQPRWAVGVGALIGVGLMTKLALGTFVPIALFVAWQTSQRRGRDCLLLLAAVGLVSLPWLVHQVTTYGWMDPLATGRHAAVVLDQPRFTGLTPEYLGKFVTISFHSFWAQFGWMGIVAPERLYWAWGVLALAAVPGLTSHWKRLCEPPWLLLVATLMAASLAYVAYNLAFEQFQGRYLFTALAPIAVLLVGGWSAWLPRRVQTWGVALIVTVLMGLNAFALTRVLVPGFAPTA
jgi:4-amino-4-deoxy-L-arabinose transferase-like glycosyltransferase